ncbi:MAG: ChaN family lipoprotein [Burkholderiales bacterium]|nr:ChaN family lipoprotein [Burkholderiales bacterium]
MHRLIAAIAAAIAATALLLPFAPGALAACVPRGTWAAPAAAGPRPLVGQDLIAHLARRDVVLLGESHEDAEHHRWQLQTIAALHGQRPDLVLGFEMFPRRVQPALDRWVAGELGEEAFLRAADWRRVWNTDPEAYLPLFHFARMNRVPMVALNVDRDLVRMVREQGLDALPVREREGVTRPAPASGAYVDFLLETYAGHERGAAAPGGGAPSAAQRKAPSRDDPAFRRFVEAQLTWDRAMAQAIATARARPSAPLVVGVIGSGHLIHRHGVPHQLADLGVTDVAVLLPWDGDADCERLTAGIADAVFGVAAAEQRAGQPRQRLGVWLEPGAGGVRIREVEKGSVAESAGVRAGDVVTDVAGVPARQPGDLTQAVRRHAPGTWLPLKVRRGSASLELVAKFPPAVPPQEQ